MNRPTMDYVVLTKDCPDVVKLLKYINDNKDKEDTLFILDDYSTPENVSLYKQYTNKVYQHHLNLDFATHKNEMWTHCKSQYSFWIDADEMPQEFLMKNIKHILMETKLPDLVAVPRRNIIEGLMPIDALKYNWDVTDGNVIQWLRGDYQRRIIKNRRGLKWFGAVHETIIPKKEHNCITLAKEIPFCLMHYKTIEQQHKSNDFYNTNWSAELNKAGGSYAE